ncbi:MAG TPA: hypothetical protein VGJ74_09335 [Burkholderiales bacterium]
MSTLNRAWFLAGSFAIAGSVVAQGQPAPQADPKTVAPVTATPGVEGSTPAAPRLPATGRNQFSSPVMGIDIKGEGLALPAGVAKPDEPLVLPAKPAAPRPATAK